MIEICSALSAEDSLAVELELQGVGFDGDGHGLGGDGGFQSGGLVGGDLGAVADTEGFH